MSVLSSAYYEELPDRDRYGNLEQPAKTVEVHVAVIPNKHVHISIGDAEVNLTIKDAEDILAGLKAAIGYARKRRNRHR